MHGFVKLGWLATLVVMTMIFGAAGGIATDPPFGGDSVSAEAGTIATFTVSVASDEKPDDPDVDDPDLWGADAEFDRSEGVIKVAIPEDAPSGYEFTVEFMGLKQTITVR